MCVYVSCLTLCSPMDYSPPGSCVHGSLQARILEWIAMPLSRGSSRPRDRTCVSNVSHIGRRVLYHWHYWSLVAISYAISYVTAQLHIFTDGPTQISSFLPSFPCFLQPRLISSPSELSQSHHPSLITLYNVSQLSLFEF